MSLESFLNSVEKALKSGQLSPKEAEIAKQQAQLSPNERKIKRGTNLKKVGKPTNTGLKTTTNTGLKTTTNSSLQKSGKPKLPSQTSGGMKNAGRGKGRTVVAETLKKIPKGKVVTKVLGKAAVPLAVAEQAYQTGKLILSEDARDEAAQDYADSANEGAIMRTVKGGLGGVTTIYGAGRAIGDMLDTQERAYKSERELENKQMDPKNQQLVQSARERQAIYMSLPQEERDLVDSMGGKEAKQYLLNKKNPAAAPKERSVSPQSQAAPASSEPAPPSSPATAGAQKSSMERQMGTMNAAIAAAPKAIIPVAEPAKVDTERALALFQNTHGGAFDPKSSVDKGKLAAIESLMAKKGSEKLTPNQFSLQIYRQSK